MAGLSNGVKGVNPIGLTPSFSWWSGPDSNHQPTEGDPYSLGTVIGVRLEKLTQKLSQRKQKDLTEKCSQGERGIKSLDF
jgi:hypothetical protein